MHHACWVDDSGDVQRFVQPTYDELRVENERLKTVEIVSLEAEVIAHVDEIERLRAERDEAEGRADQWCAAANRQVGEIRRLRARLIELTNEGWYSQVQRLEDEVERLQAVVEATRTYVFGLPGAGSKYDAVIAALAALDSPNDA